MAHILRPKIITAVLPTDRRYVGHIEIDGAKYPLAAKTDPELGMPDACVGTYSFMRIEEMPGRPRINQFYGTAIAYFANAANGEIQAIYGGMTHRNGTLPMTDGGLRMNGVDFGVLLTFIRSFPNRPIQLVVDEEEVGWLRSKFRTTVNTSPIGCSYDLHHAWPHEERRVRMAGKPARPLWLMLSDTFDDSSIQPVRGERPQEVGHGAASAPPQ